MVHQFKKSPDILSISRLSTKRASERGFVLIATILVMALLSLIAFAMLNISSVETRTTSQGAAMARAQANARMALMLAIGELQNQVGSDRRITANSSIMGESVTQPHLVGVWNSTGEGKEEDQHLTADRIATSYGPGRQSQFRSWLVPGEQATNYEFPNTQPAGDSIVLVGEGSLGSNSDTRNTVRMPRVSIGENGVETGAYSWWVSGENTKARVNLFKKPTTTVAGQIKESVAAPSMGVSEITELDTLADDESVLRGITTDTLTLIGEGGSQLPDAVKNRFFDITVDSAGLLTNTDIGGSKKDLNLAMESETLPTELTNQEIFKGGPEWDNLRTYYRNYKPLSEGGLVKWVNGVPHFTGGETWVDYVKNKNWRRHVPVPVKWQWLISHYSVPTKDKDGKPLYQVRMVFDNTVELWNPYNIPMTLPDDSHIDFKLWNMPYSMQYYLNGSPWEHTTEKKPLYWMIRDMPTHNQRQVHNGLIRLPEPLMPGEVVVYSDYSKTPKEAEWVLELRPGWELAGGLYSYTLGSRGVQMLVPGNTEIEAVLEAKAGFNPIWEQYEHFTDIYFVGPKNYPSQFAYFKGIVTKGSLDRVAPSLTRDKDANFTAASIEGIGNKRPLAIMGMRMRTESRVEPSSESPISKSEKALSKHYLFVDPWQINSSVINNNEMTMRHGDYEYYIQRVNSFNDYPLVEVTADNKGYLGTSRGARQPNNGQNHVPVREIPVMPLISMAQLQHAGLGHPAPRAGFTMPPNNPNADVPYESYPYIANAFGNSWATPFIDANKVEQNAIAPDSGANRLLHDKSWKANAALWDEWFLSSVGPQDQPFVQSSDQKSMTELLTDAVKGTGSLPNSRYRLAKNYQDDAATALVEELKKPDGYKKISSLLVCDGAFNVNSTSVVAWKAFLASLDDRSLAYLSAETGQFEQVDNQSYPVSRFTIPNGEGAKSEDMSGDQQEFLRKRWEGVRSLTSEEIDQLAIAMVEQVRKRGPFLSLGDFVNRRLTNDDDGLFGALQTAINNTSINESFNETSQEITMADITSVNYQNPKAALGKTGEGAPGYVSQADILMPLAPLIRVRSDTFRVRAYGEVINAQGQVIAKAYCEAVVQRTPEYTDPTDAADKEVWGTGNGNMLSEANKKFGRKILIKSFRWLSQQEV